MINDDQAPTIHARHKDIQLLRLQFHGPHCWSCQSVGCHHQTIGTLSACKTMQKNDRSIQLIHFSNHSAVHRMRRVSADENTTIALCQEMNDITDMKTTHTLCGCAETLSTRTHNECDTQMIAIWNTTLSSFENQNQMSELPTSV